MADSTTWLDTIAVAQSAKETTANELFDAASPGALFGRHASACSGLTWGYYGGRLWDGSASTLIANGTLTLANNATNYVEATTAGVVSSNTSAFTAGYIRIAKVTTVSSAVTVYEDHRAYPFPGNSGTVTSVALTAPAFLSVAGSPITTSGTLAVTLATQSANSIFAGPTSGGAATPAFRAAVYADMPTGLLGKPRVDAHTYAASVTLDCASYDLFELTLTGNITIAFTGGTDGQRVAVRLTQDGTGSRTVTWDSSVSFGTDITTATASTTASKIDYFGLIYNSTALKYHLVSMARGY